LPKPIAAAAALLHLAQDEEGDADEQQERQRLDSISIQIDGPSSALAVIVTPLSRRRDQLSGTGLVRNFSPEDSVPVIDRAR
jgi:hypothetical protein